MSPLKTSTTKDIIAYRKTCNADGTGLSHYIMMGSPSK